jgi:LCP family protein required for cell wall assembly
MSDQPQRSVSPAIAALLSFVFPGLGQAYAGDRRSARIHALPAAVVLAVVVLLVVVLRPTVVLLFLFQPLNALVAAALIVGLGVWRALSIAHASRLDSRPARARRSLGSAGPAAVLLIGLVVVTHAWAVDVVWSVFEAGGQISRDDAPDRTGAAAGTAGSGCPSVSSTTPGTATPSPSIAPTPAPQDRVTILFLGRDGGSASEDHLIDSLQVVSYNPRNGQLVFISLPRDSSHLPLYSGGTWPARINALMSCAEAQPDAFPDGGLGTLRREVEYIVGIPIHYHALVEHAGFVQLVDAVGGIDIVLDREIDDDWYWQDGRQTGFHMQPGQHHLDGLTALAYSRSRHGPGGSDFRRARRQQQVLLALRDRLNDPTVLANLPTVIDIAAQYVRTDVPLDRLPEIVTLIQSTTDANIERYVLQPGPYADQIPREEIGGTYMTRLKMDAVAELSVQLFGEESRYFGAQP